MIHLLMEAQKELENKDVEIEESSSAPQTKAHLGIYIFLVDNYLPL